VSSKIGSLLVAYLNHPVRAHTSVSTTGIINLHRTIQPGDVLLVEGVTRVSTAIKYLTQSTWSHAALFVGPIAGRMTEGGEPHTLIEAELGQGVISSPLSRHEHSHTRICRPSAISEEHLAKLIAFAIARIGDGYDTKNVIDLARYLLPTPPVPTRFRRRMIALGSGEPTRAICSTLIAQAFQSVRYPILPRIEEIAKLDACHENGSKGTSHPTDSEENIQKEIHHIRHSSLYTPRDFDISPYFDVVKPTVIQGFDYRNFLWGR
jgi:Permuted papain-like amidase enzyme, YaeF/YiiX, C92 family